MAEKKRTDKAPANPVEQARADQIERAEHVQEARTEQARWERDADKRADQIERDPKLAQPETAQEQRERRIVTESPVEHELRWQADHPGERYPNPQNMVSAPLAPNPNDPLAQLNPDPGVPADLDARDRNRGRDPFAKRDEEAQRTYDILRKVARPIEEAGHQVTRFLLPLHIWTALHDRVAASGVGARTVTYGSDDPAEGCGPVRQVAVTITGEGNKPIALAE